MVAARDYFSTEQLPARVPLWREGYSGLDWLALRYSPIYYGLGAPRGDGSAVILVPGFMASDLYLTEFRLWLSRIGYRAYMSDIGRNADCLERLTARLERTINKAYAQTGRKVHLVGHSLGGLLSLAASTKWPDRVASVVTMGSPFRGIRSHPLVLAAGESVRQRIELTDKRREGCFSGSCGCSVTEALKQPPAPKTPVTAIYTKTDGVVDWRYCVTDNPQDNFEVKGTHIGLAFNPAVYRQVALHLAGKARSVQS